MFQDSYAERSPEQLVKLFGHGFAREVFAVQPGAWRGPIASGYGWHLVFADMVIPSRVPAFEEIETEVKAAWIDERRAESRRRIYEAMRARYRVEVADPPTVAASPSQTRDGADKR